MLQVFQKPDAECIANNFRVRVADAPVRYDGFVTGTGFQPKGGLHPTKSNKMMSFTWSFLACCFSFVFPDREFISPPDKSPLNDYKNYILSDTMLHL